jgi:polyferredoxin
MQFFTCIGRWLQVDDLDRDEIADEFIRLNERRPGIWEGGQAIERRKRRERKKKKERERKERKKTLIYFYLF